MDILQPEVESFITTMRDKGYVIKARYTVNEKGEILEVKLIVIGRLD
jgi:hypothetical protein